MNRRLTQGQIIQGCAEGAVNAARLAGQGCALTKGTEAVTILEQALAIAMADMIGPTTQERFIDALRIQVLSLQEVTIAQYRARYGSQG